MNVIKNILFGFLIVVLIGAIVSGGYFLYQEKHKTPDELIKLEQQKAEFIYKENLEYAMNASRQYEFIVVLNPAHGGMDRGYENAFGAEKDITLAVCSQAVALNKDPKIGIFLTRSGDVDMTNEMRLAFIEQLDPDLFVDVHLNKSTGVNTYGTSVSYKTTYYNRKLSNVSFADIMEKSVVTAIEGAAVGIMDVTEADNVPILEGLTMPAISIACGDLSHDKEGELLTRENYQKNIASGILNGIMEAKEQLE